MRLPSAEDIWPIILPLLIIILIWGLFILPSCFSPHWSYLDDPTTLLMSKLIAADLHIPKPDGESGRYFPAYWIYYTVLFHFFEFDLAGYYIVQALMFLLTLFLVHSIVVNITQSRLAGFFAAFLVATASPVAENIYTLSKAEPKVLFYLLCAVYLFMRMGKVTYGRKTISLISWIGITLLIIVSILTKETAAIFVVFAATGMVISLLLNKECNRIDIHSVKSYLFLFIGSIGAILLTRGLFYALRPSVSANIYISYPINLDLFLNNLKIYAWQQPDVLFLGLLTLVLGIVSYKQRDEGNREDFVFACAWFLTGAAYVLGLLIWRQSFGYYLLIPVSFFSIATVILLSRLYRSSIYKKIGYIAIALLLLTRVYSLPYFSFIAHAQTSQDKIYTEAISTYMQIANPGERLLVEEWPFFVEPVTQSNRLLKFFGKEHLIVAGVQDIINNMEISADILKLYQVSEIPNRESRYPRKNDYILTLTGNRQSPWVLRGISPFLNEKGSVYKARGLDLEMIATDNIKWNEVVFTAPFLLPKLRTFSNGYSLYKVNDPLPTVIWEGRWSDNWISSKAKCSLRVIKPGKGFTFEGFVSEHTIPTSLNIMKDNKIIKKVNLDKSGTFYFTVEISSREKDDFIHIGFNTEKTFNPKDLGLSNDNRNLSVQLSVRDIESSAL